MPLSTVHRTQLAFLFLFIVHLSAAFAPWPLMVRQSIWLLGVLFFGLYAWLEPKKIGPEAIQTNFNLPNWTWLLLLIAGFFVRTVRYWAVPHWPLLDECCTAQHAVQLARQWDWKFFYNAGEQPPPLHWASGTLLKWTSEPFLALWLPVFIISCLTLYVLTQALREMLAPLPAFLASAFLAISFWPSYSQSFSLECAFLPAWEAVLLLLFIRLIKEERPKLLALFIFGLWAGAGYWTYTAWPVVALAALFALLSFHPQRPKTALALPAFLGFAISFSFFLAVSYQHGGYGTHILGFSAFQGWFKSGQVLLSAMDYINILFWGHWSTVFYGPENGGFLNPILAAFFWIGIWSTLVWLKTTRTRTVFLVVLVLFLLPGILSQDTETSRIIQLFPVLLTLCGIGAFSLLKTLTPNLQVWALALLLIVSFCFDLPQLTSSFRQWSSMTTQAQAIDNLLEKMTRVQGPGLCFTQFRPQRNDEESLSEMVYPRNSIEKKDIDRDQVRWCCLLIHYDEVPFIRGQFPAAQWLRPPQSSGGDDQLMLGFIPVTKDRLELWKKWQAAGQWFQQAYWNDRNICNGKTYQEALNYWLAPTPLLKNDKFLETCYWEEMSDFYYSHNFETHYELQVDALQKAVSQGYPAPHLLYDLGCLLLRRRRLAEAKKDLELAQKADPKNPNIQYALDYLRTLSTKK